MFDNTSGASEASDLSPEVADALGLGPSSTTPVETVKPEGEVKPKADKKTAKTTTTKKPEGKDSSKPEPSKPVDKKPAGEEEEEEETTPPEEFEVAGHKYASYEEAKQAINRISGDNTRLKGDLNTARQNHADVEAKYNEVLSTLNQYVEANKAWQQYYEGNAGKPETKEIDIQAEVSKAVQKELERTKQTQLQVQYQTELDEIWQEPDIKEVLPLFKELVDEYDGQPKVSPKKLFQRARNEYKAQQEKNLSDPEAFDREVNARVERELAKRGTKISPPGGQRASTRPAEPNLSPEIADALRDIIPS